MKAILYTSTRCPKCPGFRKLLRAVGKELGMSEGRDYVEKLIDGDRATPGAKLKLEGQEYFIVDSETSIKPDETPAAVGGQDHTIEALQYQIASTPALVIDDEVAYVGEIPTKEELMKRLSD
jgi:hypothetical protein